jgi:hypothetical protein
LKVAVVVKLLVELVLPELPELLELEQKLEEL